jgi:hypothetical protein
VDKNFAVFDIEKYIKDSKVLAYLGIKLKVLSGYLTDLSA